LNSGVADGEIDLWHATAGAEGRVKAAERLFDDPVDLEATRRFLEGDANHLVIAYVDGQPAGFVSGTELRHPDQPEPELFLNELGVDPAFRGRAIGKKLVANLWEIAQSRGCRGMWVLTDDENPAALKVYAGAGGARLPEAQVMFGWGET
jgi:ribosomal protein S18 acetylase RimI-like enzyme